MTDANDNNTLANETANALLTEIKSAASGGSRKGDDFVLNLARAYALVRDSMPKPPSRGSVS